jgi:hypothetical protein
LKALQVRRNVGKLGLARIASAVSPVAAARVGPLEHRTVDEPELPGPGWHRVRTRLAGICGSDLALVEGHASTYFDDWVSFPFVPGHEVVGELVDGTRVVLEPVLGHEARGVAPPQATATTTRTSSRVGAGSISSPASRPGSAAPPAAVGRPSSWRTSRSCTASTTP